MVNSQLWYVLFLMALVAERLAELAISHRNARWSFDRGAVEFGTEHFRWMKLLHSAFFFACASEVLVPGLGWPMLAVALLSQGIRYWAIDALGRQWNIRILVIPGARRVKHGPYRFCRHPNYLAVVLEGVAVPLVHGAWITAVVFSLLNAWLLTVRIRTEEAALVSMLNDE